MTIKVVRGNPTPEELAAALTVVRARAVTAAAEPSTTDRPHDAWSAPSRIATHHMPHPGPTAWGRTYWPT
ncbi:acyl-CoA carboxylase subunit epsilon [Streptomyces sp. ME01-18h]|uniref:acyl-CoA carboxylase subunit epsilon n=1 Tax=Streptomyces sp. ME01-18h TaxID=462920 RepID=UPI0029AFF7D3|nr:acyl-CoA carboxylase subunit epsilon [Streptomyces sp. ME01-18h]MDX3399725.1 acyl-CoA carboxylase subunit epsilon [Streptomyces sp. ME01-18h]